MKTKRKGVEPKKAGEKTMKEYRAERRSKPENREKHRERNRELYRKKNKDKMLENLRRKADAFGYKLVEKQWDE